MKIKTVGYWKSRYELDLPNVLDFVDSSWSGLEKESVIKYLRNGQVVKRYRGYSNCRICEKLNGTTCHGDGTWQWPEGFLHYIIDHGVKPPQEFIDYCLNKS